MAEQQRAKRRPTGSAEDARVEAKRFERECRQAVKRAKRAQVQRLNRKGKRGEATAERVEADLATVKALDAAVLISAIADVRSGGRPKLSDLEPRARELGLLLIRSAIVRRFLAEFEVTAKRSRRKREKRRKADAKRDETRSRKRARVTDSTAEGGRASSSAVKGLRVGQKVRCLVDGAAEYGVFAKFLHRGAIVGGMCHVSELANRFVADPASEFPPGTWVNAKVIQIDATHERAKLSFKAAANETDVPRRANLEMCARELLKGVHDPGLVPKSEFVASLSGASSKADGDDVDNERKKRLVSRTVVSILKTLAQSHGTGSTGKRKNRLGQRARHKLNQMLYGGPSQDAETNSERDGAAERADTGRNADEDAGKQVGSAPDGAVGGAEKPVDAKESEEDEANLHPSWAAKRKQQKAVKFQGTRITF